MTKRQANYWLNRIAAYESTNPSVEVFTEHDDSPLFSQEIWCVSISTADGNQYHMWDANDCKKWLNDAY